MKNFTNTLVLLDEKNNKEDLRTFVFKDNLKYQVKPDSESKDIKFLERNDMWRYFHLFPLKNYSNIVSLSEGRTLLKRIPSLEKYLKGALFYCKNEGENPTGTFKDREASYIMSKVKEFGIKKIVCHSTGNTGRAYCVYAKKANIEVFFFLPLSCMDKCDKKMLGEKIHIIAIDGHFNQVSTIAKLFASKNNLQVIAPTHEKLEGKATLAYEQYEELPSATIFAQTIAGGYGVMGFLLGHKRLKNKEITSEKYIIPKIYALQVDDNCTITKGYQKGVEKLSDEDLLLPALPFEKTLQSTNPLKTFSAVKKTIEETDGTIESSSIEGVESIKEIFEEALSKEGIELSYKDEKSPYISFAGLVKLAREGRISKKDVIYMLVTGKGCGGKDDIEPEVILKPTKDGYEIVKDSDNFKNLL
jgi:threonine synthase